jgi:hypothetical protein
MIPSKKVGASLFFFLGVLVTSAVANIEITLKNEFIEQFKNTATISVSFVVDKAHVRANPGSKDGDLHVAGRADEVGLAIVAEIMNAASQKSAVDAIHAAEGKGNAIPLTGVWRIWCEHGGDVQQNQEQPPQKPFNTTNPPHVFEIHPITTLNSKSIIGSLHPIAGYKPKDAENAFLKYESLKSHITVGAGTTSVTTTMAGFNYVEFMLVPLEDESSEELADGTAILASARTLDGEILVHTRRMVFVKDSPEENALKKLKSGEGMHVLGVPRISLKLLSFRANHHTENEQMLDWGLPYEIAVVGFYGTVPKSKIED